MSTGTKRRRLTTFGLLLALLGLQLSATRPAHAEVREKRVAISATDDSSYWQQNSWKGDFGSFAELGFVFSFVPAVGLVAAHTGIALSKTEAPPPRSLGVVELAFSGVYAGASILAFSDDVPELGTAYLISSVALGAVGTWTLIANARHEKVTVGLTPGGMQVTGRFH